MKFEKVQTFLKKTFFAEHIPKDRINGLTHERHKKTKLEKQKKGFLKKLFTLKLILTIVLMVVYRRD